MNATSMQLAHMVCPHKLKLNTRFGFRNLELMHRTHANSSIVDQILFTYELMNIQYEITSFKRKNLRFMTDIISSSRRWFQTTAAAHRKNNITVLQSRNATQKVATAMMSVCDNADVVCHVLITME